MVDKSGNLWISRDYLKCSGCRRCEIACTLEHENRIWPEASRIRVFMLIPGVEIPHLCTQCTDYPCVYSCPYEALSIESETSAVLVDKEKCVACGICIDACPGKVPHIHPRKNHVLICDLCNGDPQCVKVCRNAGYHCLSIVREKSSISQNLFARTPEELTRDVSENLYGERALELL